MVRLGDHATKIGSGSTPRGGEAVYVRQGVPFLRSMNVHFDGVRTEGLAFISKRQAERLKNVVVQENDVLLNITGASIGRVTVAPRSMAGARVNQHVCIIRPNADLLPKFIAYFFASAQVQEQIMQVQVGATRQALTKRMIDDWQVPMPPLETQSAVVADLDRHFTILVAGRAALNRVNANLKRYRAAVLKSACEGRLVTSEAELARAEGRSFETGYDLLARVLATRRENWKGPGKYAEPEEPRIAAAGQLPKGWAWGSFDQIADRVTVGFVGSMKHEYIEQGVPFLRGQNVRENKFDPDGLLYVSKEFHRKLSKSALRPGDLAVVRSGSVGVTCVIPNSLPEANCSDLVLIQRPRGFVPQYGAYYMNSLAKRHVADGTVGVALLHFNTKSVATLPVPLPPFAEQIRIVAEVERRLSVVEGLEVALASNLKRANSLEKAALARGFNQTTVPKEATSGSGFSNEKASEGSSGNTNKPLVMKRQKKHTTKSVVEAVKANRGRLRPQALCLACGFGEDVEDFFELLRDCRSKGTLVVPSGKNSVISLPKP